MKKSIIVCSVRGIATTSCWCIAHFGFWLHFGSTRVASKSHWLLVSLLYASLLLNHTALGTASSKVTTCCQIGDFGIHSKCFKFCDIIVPCITLCHVCAEGESRHKCLPGASAAKGPVISVKRLISCPTYCSRLHVNQHMAEHLLPELPETRTSKVLLQDSTVDYTDSALGSIMSTLGSIMSYAAPMNAWPSLHCALPLWSMLHAGTMSHCLCLHNICSLRMKSVATCCLFKSKIWCMYSHVQNVASARPL